MNNDTYWYKNAIFYSLDVETYFDSKNDGIGDFQGLSEKLDYIASLGINCIWLLPFYTSPNRDNGYDVKDYYSVDARLGSLEDFKTFVDNARQLGIKVIIDLVVNHTSVEHPWFQEARKDKTSKYYHYYVWSEEPLAYEKEHLMFTGEEDTVWTYDEMARQYYLHRFYKEQPDLNISNREVQKEILQIMNFWLDLGICGFRLDAAEMLIEPYGMKGAQKNELAKFLTEMRSFLSSKNEQAILLAEVNTGPEKLDTYLHGQGRMQMVFNFFINQNLFLALAKEDTAPLIEAFEKMPILKGENQWLNFLRHHDELSLSLLSKDDRNAVFEKYAPEKSMRIYGRGIRRRIAPMLNGNCILMELYYSLMFSLPGIPLIRYGDEIGMGDDLSLPGRLSVRTPMQWSNTINGGFSKAAANQLVHPVIDNGSYSYKSVNVDAAQKDAESFLYWLKQLIAIRKSCPEIGVGTMKLIDSGYQQVLAHSICTEEDNIFFFHNLSKQTIELSLNHLPCFNTTNIIIGKGNVTQNGSIVNLNGFGYIWYKENIKNS